MNYNLWERAEDGARTCTRPNFLPQGRQTKAESDDGKYFDTTICLYKGVHTIVSCFQR